MIVTEERDPATGLAPPPVSTVIVHRKSFPRVPPEVLLREYAAKFHLNGLTLTSLLNATSPVTSLVLPLYITRNDASCRGGMSFVDRLLRDAPRRPPVPLECIKRATPSLSALGQEVEKYKQEGQDPRKPQKQQQEPRLMSQIDCAANFKFDEAAPSRLTAVTVIRSHSALEEREVLWGYDTGAVMHIRLQIFAADLLFITRRGLAAARGELRESSAKAARAAAKAKATARARRESSNSAERGNNDSLAVTLREDVSGKFKDSVNSEFEKEHHKALRKPRNSTHKREPDDEYGYTDYLEVKGDEEEEESEDKEDDIPSDTSDNEGDGGDRKTLRRTPRGVSLLGFHPVGGVTCVGFDAHTLLGISGGADGTLLTWDIYSRYYPVAREAYGRDEDPRHSRATQQFSTYVRTRSLAQTLRRAHDGAVSVIATHCELLLTGGADGLVRVWSCGNGGAASMARGPAPQYVEQQSFRCGTWVRHIWCAAERTAQGDGVLVTDDTGAITALRGCTLAQPPPVAPGSSMQQDISHEFSETLRNTTQWKRYLNNTSTLMDAIRTSSPFLTNVKSQLETRKEGIAQPTLMRRVPGTGTAKPSNMHKPLGVGSSKRGGNEWALALLTRGVVKRALVVSRVLRIFGAESRVGGRAINPGGGGASMPLPATHESTSAITRLIPLFERNLLITLGYSPVVRIVDMRRLVSVSVVEHPDFSGAGKSYNTESKTGNSDNNTQGSNITGPGSLKSGARKVMTEAVRFIDMIYISTFEYLILLDNCDTVFVWDTATNKVLTTWSPPNKNSSRRAMGLLTCGEEHYCLDDSSTTRPQGMTFGRSPKDAMGMMKTQDIDSVLGITRVPFFVVCTDGVELCEVLIAAHARVEVKGHEDTVVGLCVVSTEDNSEKSRGGAEIGRLMKEMKEMKKQQRRQQQQFTSSYGSLYNTPASASKLRKTATSRSVTSDYYDSEVSNDEESDEMCDETLSWMQNKLSKVDAISTRVLSCSIDGNIRFWTTSMEPLQAYSTKQLVGGFGSSDTSLHTSSTTREKPLGFSPVGRASRHGSHRNVSPSDVTSFHYSAAWNLAITGHDDGSIRFWPCNQQIATCKLQKDLHHNAVSGLTEVEMPWTSDSVYKRASAKGGRSSVCVMELLVTVSYDGHLAAWANPRECKAVPYGRVRVSRNELICVCFEATNELIVVGDSSGVLSTWRARDLQPRRAIPSRPPSPWQPTVTGEIQPPILISREVAVGPGAVRSNNLYSDYDKCAGVMDRAAELKKRVGHTEAVTTLLVDGNLIFSGGEDGRVFLWDLHMGFLIREYFPLHDRALIEQHRRAAIQKLGDICLGESSFALGSSRYCNPPTAAESKDVVSCQLPRCEDVASIVLLKSRQGDFIVGTREGWVYRFRQKDPYPQYTFYHTSPVRTLCVIREMHEELDELDACGSSERLVELDLSIEENENCDFDIAIGGEDGTLAVVRGTYFASLA